MQLNVRKSNVMVIGRHDDDILPDLCLGPGISGWIKEIKYLGVYLQSRKGLRVNIDSNCRKFLDASFSILQRFGHLSEPVLCEIISTVLAYFNIRHGMFCITVRAETYKVCCI